MSATSISRQRPRSAIVALCGVLVLVAGAGRLSAIGSSSEKPEESAQERERRATASYNEGVEHMQQAVAIARRGDSAFAFNYRATADAKARRQLEHAVDDFREALRLNPGMKQAHNNLGYVWRKLGRLPESRVAYQQALMLDSSFAQAREYLGETYLAMGFPDSATIQLTWLRDAASPYADSLQRAIDLHALQQIDQKMKSGH